MVGGVIGLLLVALTLPAPLAKAATTAELQAQIQSLMAQIVALQAQLNNQAPASSCSVFTRDLTIGNTGADVTNLQKFLISKGHTIPAGATGYFGEQTRSALVKFQLAHSIAPAVGYFGPLTRAKAQALCTPVVTTPTTPTNPTTPTTPTETLSGEADIERFEVKDGDDTDLEESDVDAEVMEISFRVTDGDVKITRFDLGFTPDVTNNEKDPWDTFKTVAIYQGTKKIADIDASRERNWKEDSPTNGDYLLRMSGLSYIVKEDKDVELTVKVSVQKTVKGANDGEIWNMFVPNNGIRGLDAAGAVVYAGDTADAVTLNIDRAGSTDELLIRRSDADPNATVLQLEDSRRSGFNTIFAFDIDTDDSRNDIEIRRLPVQLTVSTSTLNTFMRDIRIVIDGNTYTKETTVDGVTGTVTFEFDRNELVIDAGDRVTAKVEVDFKSLSSAYEGSTIYARVSASGIDAEGADDLTGSQLAGSATGETHTLITKGSNVSSNSGSQSAKVTSVSGDLNDYATFELTVTLTAFGQDVYIPLDNTGVQYQMTDSVGNALSASGTAIVSSNAKEEGNYFRINEGESKNVTLTVTYLPNAQNTVARLQLTRINYSDSAQAPTQTWQATPANNYRTNAVTIVN